MMESIEPLVLSSIETPWIPTIDDLMIRDATLPIDQYIPIGECYAYDKRINKHMFQLYKK